MRTLKVKITLEFRNHKPAIWVNAYAHVTPLGNGLYRVESVDGDYISTDKFDMETRSFYTHD
jgi:hypothetical protein